MPFQDKHTRRDKQLLYFERELNRLRQAQWRAPVIPLERPYQRGWCKTFTLREDALHHPDVRVFETVLAVVNQQVHSRNREFIRRSGVAIQLRPRVIDLREWTRLAWPLRHRSLFAYGQWPVEGLFPWSSFSRRHSVQGFRLLHAWWLEELVLPFMITHQRVDLPEVRERIAEIENVLRRGNGWERLHRLHGHRTRYECDPAPRTVLRASAAFADQVD